MALAFLILRTVIFVLILFVIIEVPYEIEVHTGDVRGAGTDANVFVVLYGKEGKSEEFWLRSKTDNFERNEVDKFKVAMPKLMLCNSCKHLNIT